MDLRIQRLRTRALWQKKAMEYTVGLCSKSEVDEAYRVWKNIASHNVASKGGPDLNIQIKEPSISTQVEMTDKQKEILQKLRGELDAIDREKNRKINELSKLPRNVNHKTAVQEIKNLRERWRLKSDEVYYFLSHGEAYKAKSAFSTPGLPEDDRDFESSEFWKSLPRDATLLNKQLLNTRSNLSKARRMLKSSKTEVKKADYEKKARKLEIELRMIDRLLGML